MMVSGRFTSPKDHSRICSGEAMPIRIASKDEDEDTYQPVQDNYYEREDDFGSYQADSDFASAGGFTFKGDSDDDDTRE